MLTAIMFVLSLAQVRDIPKRTEKPAEGQAPRPAFYRNHRDVGCSVGSAVSREEASESFSAQRSSPAARSLSQGLSPAVARSSLEPEETFRNASTRCLSPHPLKATTGSLLLWAPTLSQTVRQSGSPMKHGYVVMFRKFRSKSNEISFSRRAPGLQRPS